MKTILVFAFTIISTALIAETTNSAPASTNTGPAVVLTLQASAATITAPLVLTNGAFGQADSTELPQGGKATFSFTLTNGGSYVLTAVVNAADEASNSFYVNIDGAPTDPLMIWDIDPTSGFEERTVAWRGNGDANNDEISPKKFALAAGPHKLVIIGREPTELKSVSICLEK